jgi:molybdopterin-guanine dinucleotide biosynthesis protein A
VTPPKPARERTAPAVPAPAANRPRGAVLAGGRARRLGGAKADALLGGRALIEYPLAALREGGLEAAVVAKGDTPLPELSVPVWREPDEQGPPSFHPLRGVVIALRRSAPAPVVVLGCDMPFVPAALVAHLAALDAPIVVPSVAGRLEPLAARYDSASIPAFEEALAAGEPVREAIARLEPVLVTERELERFGDPRRLFMNVNTPEDLARAEALLD